MLPRPGFGLGLRSGPRRSSTRPVAAAAVLALLASFAPLVPPAPPASSAPLATLATRSPALPGDPPDPFAPGPRWSHAPPAAAPWIPGALTFAAAGELVWAATGGASPRLLALSAAPLAEVPLLFEDASASALGPGASAGGGAVAAGSLAGAGPAGRALYAVRREPGPEGGTRALATRHDPVAAAQGAGFAPVWTHDAGLASAGAARLACDGAGDALLFAVHDPVAGAVQLDRLEPATGALLARTTLAGGALRSLCVAQGARRVAVSAGLDLWLLDEGGEPLLHEVLPAATGAVALSADGATLLAGVLGSLRVFREGPDGAYAEQPPVLAAPGEVAVRAAVSGAGETFAVAWWDALTGTAARLEVLDGPTGARLQELAQAGPAPGLQNLPSGLALSADGARIALGLWGLGDARPELVLLDRDWDQPLLEVDTGGSVLDLALDAAGTRVVCSVKDTHANQFATGGRIALFATGERDLQVLEPPTAGGLLHLAHARPGTAAVLFALGAPAPRPLAFAGVAGTLGLDPGLSALVLGTAADPSGRADLELALPTSPALVGLGLAGQALAQGTFGLALSAVVVRPLIL